MVRLKNGNIQWTIDIRPFWLNLWIDGHRRELDMFHATEMCVVSCCCGASSFLIKAFPILQLPQQFSWRGSSYNMRGSPSRWHAIWCWPSLDMVPHIYNTFVKSNGTKGSCCIMLQGHNSSQTVNRCFFNSLWWTTRRAGSVLFIAGRVEACGQQRHQPGQTFQSQHAKNPLANAKLRNVAGAVPWLLPQHMMIKANSSEVLTGATDPCRRLVDGEGYTDVHLAVHSDPELLRHLLSQVRTPKDVDAKDAFQRTPLMIAVFRDNLTAARSLLKAKASVTSRDSVGATPLAIATELGRHYCILLLMHYGAASTLQTANFQGKRPIHFAAASGDLLLVKLLVKWQCNLAARDHEGKSALDYAASFGQGAVVEFMTHTSPNISHDWNLSSTAGDVEMQGTNLESENKRHHAVHPHDLKVTFGVLLQKLLHKFMHPDRITRRVVPVFCHCACACAVWDHVVSRSFRWSWMPKASLIFEVSVPVILAMSQYIIRMDPGIAPPTDGIKEFMSLVASEPRERLPKPKQLCTTTWILKDLRTKYCTLTKTCIEEFDHFCILLNAPIGKRNHRLFFCLMVLEVISQMSHAALCLCTLAHAAVESSTFREATAQHPVVAFLLLVHSATIPGISFLVLVQLVLISLNVTMNEVLHMRRYEHFWSENRFRNPFSKGNVARNCLDFWWIRTRGKTVDITWSADSICP